MIRSKCSRSADGAASTWGRAGLVLLFTLVPLPAQALEWGDGLQVHGFLTQGYVNTTANNFFGDSEDGSFEFRELGVNASYRLASSVLISGQMLSRRAGEMYRGALAVDYALMDWEVLNNPQRAFGLRLGRIKNPLGLYNETRDVAFTRPGIFVPQQIYFDKVRNLLLSSDGAHIYGRVYGDHGHWTYDLGVGRTAVDKNVEYIFLNNDFAGDLDSDGLSYVGRVAFETPGGNWRLGISAAKAALDFAAEPSDPIGSGDIDIFFWIASLQYNAERWSLTAEYMEEPLDYDGFGIPFDERDGTVQGYYLQGSYLLRSDLELMLRYAEGFADKDDRDGRAASASIRGLAPPHAFFQKDWTVGLRWDVTPSFMLRAEYQWSNGIGNLSLRENPNPRDTEEDWEMFSLLASYRF